MAHKSSQPAANHTALYSAKIWQHFRDHCTRVTSPCTHIMSHTPLHVLTPTTTPPPPTPTIIFTNRQTSTLPLHPPVHPPTHVHHATGAVQPPHGRNPNCAGPRGTPRRNPSQQPSPRHHSGTHAETPSLPRCTHPLFLPTSPIIHTNTLLHTTRALQRLHGRNSTCVGQRGAPTEYPCHHPSIRQHKSYATAATRSQNVTCVELRTQAKHNRARTVRTRPVRTHARKGPGHPTETHGTTKHPT